MRGRGGQPTSGTYPPYRYPPVVDPETVSLFGHPAERPVAIIQGSREWVLRSQTVIRADDNAINLVGEVDAAELFLIKVAQDVAATVEKHQGAKPVYTASGSIGPDGEVAAAIRTGEDMIFDHDIGIIRQFSPCSQSLGHAFSFDSPRFRNIFKGDFYVKRKHGGELGIIAIVRSFPDGSRIRRVTNCIFDFGCHGGEG